MKQKYFIGVLFLILNTALFFNSNNWITYLLLCFIFIYSDFFKKDNSRIYRLYLLFFMIHYYFKNFFNAIENNYLLFWDNQYLFHKINCNIIYSTYILQLDKSLYSCPSSLGFGVLEDIIKIKSDPWIMSILLFIIVILSFINIYLFSEHSKKNLILIFFVSPSMIFLLNSLNSDIFIFIFSIYIINKNRFYLKIPELVILTIFIQLKIYPIALLLGLLIFSIISKTKKNINLNSFFLVLNLIPLIYDIINSSSSSFSTNFLKIPVVYAPNSSFGFLADVLTYFDVPLTKEIGNFNLIKLLILVFLTHIVLVYFRKIKIIYKDFDDKTNNLLIIFLPMVFLINFFGNHGYKFVFNFLIIYLCFNFFNIYGKSFLIIYIYLFPIYFVLTNTSYPIVPQFEANVFSTSIWFISRLIFYIFNFNFLMYYLRLLLINKSK